MIFSCPQNAGVVSNGELTIFKYEGKQVLVITPETYENAIDTVKHEFGIDDDSRIQLSTSDLVEWGIMDIRPSAWAAVRSIIARIDVTAVARKQGDDRTLVIPPVAGPSNAISTSQKGKGTASPQEDLPVQLSEVKRRPSVGRQIASQARTPGKAQFSAKSSKSKMSEVPPQEPKPSGSRLPHPDLPASKKEKESTQHVVKREVYETPDVLMEEEEESLPVLKSPKKAKRQRVDSDFGEDEVQILGETSAKRQRPAPEEVEEDELVVVEMKAPARPSEALKAVDRRTSPVLSPRGDPKSGASHHAVSRDGRSRDSGSKGSSATVIAFDPNISHQVTIIYDDGTQENSTPFKTKNKHSVYKVLRTACLTFGFSEDDLARANLYTLDEAKGEYNVCPRDTTIGQLGITESIPLFLLIDDEDED